MIYIIAFVAMLGFALVFLKYMTNIQFIVTGDNRNCYWSFTLIGIGSQVFVLMVRPFFSNELLNVVSGIVLVFVLWNIWKYFTLEYADAELKRRAESRITNAMDALFETNPLPYFIKRFDKDRGVFVTIKVNPAFIKLILDPNGIPLSKYVGSTDYDWFPQFANEYQDQDMHVYSTGDAMTVFSAQIIHNGIAKNLSWTKVKYGELIIGNGNFTEIAINE